jgi:hypothetical protein
MCNFNIWEVKSLNKKVIGIFIVTLLIGTSLSVMGTINDKDVENLDDKMPIKLRPYLPPTFSFD